MKKTPAIGLGLLVLVLFFNGCHSLNKLNRYDFSGRRMAVMAAIPPSPKVFTNYWYDQPLDWRRPIISAVRLGTGIAKEIEADRAEARLDSALHQIDVSERIAKRTLLESATYLNYEPVNNPRNAEFIMDLRIHDYGILAESWQSATYLLIKGEILLFDNQTHKPIWKEGVEIKERISPKNFGLAGTSLGNVLTAQTLANLSVEEMIIGFKNLADFTADELTLQLRDDYFRTR